MTRQIALGLLLGMPLLLTGHEGHAGKKAVVVGLVVDTACYLGHDSKGVKHVDCATGMKGIVINKVEGVTP